MNQVIIDTNETWKELAHSALVGRNIPAIMKHLKVGDYEIYSGGRILNIERKSTNDFLSTFDVLTRRIPAMSQLEDMSMLLIEGRITYDTFGVRSALKQISGKWESTGITWYQIQSFLLSIQMKGIMVHWTENFQDTIKTIEHWYRYMEKGVFPLQVKKRGMVWEDRAMSIWLSLEGIGKTKAKKLLGYSIQEIANMERAELQAILKSKKTAEKLYDNLRRK